MLPARRLYRSRRNRVIAGVAGGLAEYFGLTPTGVRILLVISCLLPGPQFIFYLAAWLLIPNEPI